MITKRIIPCLDVKDGRVVKGVNFLGLADVSSPIKLAEYYSKCGADELVFYDITAEHCLPISFVRWQARYLFLLPLAAALTLLRILTECLNAEPIR